MPSRVIREAGLTSKKLAAVSDFGERLYWRIYQAVDDFGRFHAHPDIIRARCFPVMMEKVSARTVRAGRDELARVGLVLLYGSDMGEVLQITKFEQRIRAGKSNFPPPDVSHLPVICQTDDGLGTKELRNYGTTEQGTTPPSPPAPTNGAEQSAEAFECFWQEYPKPRRRGKFEARQAWTALRPSTETVARIMRSLAAWKASFDWLKDGGKFIPWPQKFLRRHRWEEIPDPGHTGPDELEGL